MSRQAIPSADARISIQIVRLRVDSVKMSRDDYQFAIGHERLWLPVFTQTYTLVLDRIRAVAELE